MGFVRLPAAGYSVLEDDRAGALPSIRVKEGQDLASLAQVFVSNIFKEVLCFALI